MRIDEIEDKLLVLKRDNPGGQWLADKQACTLESGRRPSGRYNILGSTTGWYSRYAFVPVDVLVEIPGTNQEQSNVRNDSLEYLVKYMDTHGKLPDTGSGEEYVPMIVVDQDGKPWVNEGNHRIMAAKQLGFYTLPVEIKYYNGGEDKPGKLNPAAVKKYDSLILKMGYGFGKYK